MEKFRRTHPNYEAYRSEHYATSAMPDEFWPGISGLIVKNCDGDALLKEAVNAVLTSIPEGPTTNWGGSFLVDDLYSALSRLREKPFQKIMDALGELVDLLRFTDFAGELDEYLEEIGVGYRVQTNLFGKSSWELRDESAEAIVSAVEEAATEVGDVCAQALEHLNQIASNMRIKDERSRKRAVADALSAMESLYKSLSGETDIDKAYRALRAQPVWGPQQIIKDGSAIWGQVHHLYPDVRHGQADTSTMSEEEAEYWIERVVTIVKYLSRRHC